MLILAFAMFCFMYAWLCCMFAGTVIWKNFLFVDILYKISKICKMEVFNVTTNVDLWRKQLYLLLEHGDYW